jgi:hypothetical protein
VAQALDAIVYRIADTRGQAVPEELFEDVEGVIVRDGWRAYEPVDEADHPLCWLPINRWLERAEHANRVEPRPLLEDRDIELAGPGRPPERLLRFVEGVRAIARAAVRWVEENEDAGRDKRKAAADRFHTELSEHVTRGYTQEDAARIAGTLERHLDRGEVFTFVRKPGVPWHNNGAKQAIRKGVHHRKVSGGPALVAGCAPVGGVVVGVRDANGRVSGSWTWCGTRWFRRFLYLLLAEGSTTKLSSYKLRNFPDPRSREPENPWLAEIEAVGGFPGR